jgi:hypothetical protein
MFTAYDNVVVRAAKAWDSLHAGTVPVLLTFAHGTDKTYDIF